MTAVALVRAPFQPLAVAESWDSSLLKEAAELIGYRPKAIAEAEQTRKRSLDEVILARALEKLDIQPFTLKSVQAYQAHMLRKVHEGESSAATQYMHSVKGERVVFRVGIPAFLASWESLPVAQYRDGYGSLQGYAEAIPAFVVQRMISLKKELGNDVTFSVEQLNVSREDLNTEKKPAPLPADPFLIATFRGVSCYVDVWDEPGFEGRRTV